MQAKTPMTSNSQTIMPRQFWIERERVQRIFKLALPVTLGLASSFIMIFIDLAMVGRLGPVALAAIGLGGFSFTFILSAVSGVAPAVQGLVAKDQEQQHADDEAQCAPLNAGLLLVCLIGLPLSFFCIWVAPNLFSILSSDEQVIQEGTRYLQIILFAVAGMGMIQAFEGFWAGVGKTRVYMLNILFVNLLNIFFNYAFIFGNFGAPALGTAGAALGSVLAVYSGVALYFLLTLRSYRRGQFLKQPPSKKMVLNIFSIGLPENIRDALFSLGYLVFYWLVGLIGTSELAAMNILIRIALMLAVFPTALGVAATTLVSEAVGRGNLDDANRWGWDVCKLGVFWVTLVGLPFLLFPTPILSLFTSDAYVLSVAAVPLQITGALTGVTSLIFILAYVLVSLGDGLRVLLVSFGAQWLLFLPAVWVVGPHLNYGLLEIWLVQTAYALISTAMITALWCDGRWKKIQSLTTTSTDMNIKLATVGEVLARIFLVLWFSICVIDGWGYLLFGVYLTGEPVTLFLSSLMQVKWFWWTLKIVQTIGTLSLLFNYKPALGLALLTPTSLFICLFYFFELTDFIPFGVLIIVSTLILARKYAAHYRPLWKL